MQTIDNVLVGIGCSWTQGEGGYTDEVYKKHNGRVNLPMRQSMHLISMEHENSWVNVLCRDHLTDYTPINLGQRGIGNRGAARTLYLSNIDWKRVKSGIVVFMLSGFERFDFFRQDCEDKINCGENPYNLLGHYNFQTVWPHLGYSKLWKIYAKNVYSDEAILFEQICNILEVQNFCKSHGLKFVLANAFDSRGHKFLQRISPKLSQKIDWTCCIHQYRNYDTFADLLVEKDDWLKGINKLNYSCRYQKLNWPKKYLTNCVHPTIDGYKIIASELYNFIKDMYKIA